MQRQLQAPNRVPLLHQSAQSGVERLVRKMQCLSCLPGPVLPPCTHIMQRFADRIKSFDGFPKTLDEFRVRTSIGATGTRLRALPCPAAFADRLAAQCRSLACSSCPS